MGVLGNFKNPPKGYGEVAFFWWHGDKITKEKLLWILEQLKDYAISGLQINYAHSDTGGRLWGLTLESDPKPLSDEWFELVGWFMEECKKYSISLSLSDYTLGSPGQGFYTDEVIKNHPELIGQELRFIDSKVEVEKVEFSENPMEKSLGVETIKEFYGKFEEHFPNECGKGINFFFSDELNFNVSGNLWSDGFADEFKKLKGYDIVPKLNAIFTDIGDETPKIRLDYYDVIVRLSEEGYFKPIYDWHEERNMTFGCDHGGRGRDVTEFGDYFRTMKWNQGPGNDQPKLGSDIVKSKVSSSIAHLYNRPRTWLEGFYSSGWGTSSGDVIDAVCRNFALGHNLLSLHGLYYSTHGSMWEWAPPCNHHHMPYWSEMQELLGCTERLSYLLSQGVHRCDVAVIYPVAAVEADKEAGKKSVQTAFETAEKLYKSGIDFDFIDFESIERSTIENRLLKVSGEEYKAVIIPSMKAVRFNMLVKLEEFSQNGGRVICVGELPSESDRIGRNDDMLDEMVKNITDMGFVVKTAQNALETVKANILLDVKTDSENPYILHRIIDGQDIYMVYNIEKGEEVFFRALGKPRLLDPWTGEMGGVIRHSCDENGTYINMPLGKKEIQLIVFDTESDTLPTVENAQSVTTIKVDGEWGCEIKPTLNNVYGDYRLPAFDGYIGAEIRRFKFKITDEDCSGKDCDDADWQKSTYSFGTYFWVLEGKADEKALIEMTEPNENFAPYNFSMSMGIEGDAGHQGSFHGLKAKISDDFIGLGKMRLTYASSSSEYESDNEYYLFTTVYSDIEQLAEIDTGSFKPEKVWINHKIVASKKVLLKQGSNYVLLKYSHGGRTHFILRTKNLFVQKMPLSMTWYKNPDILPFDSMPQQSGKYCWYRFNSPPAMESLKLDCIGEAEVFADGRLMKNIGNEYFPQAKSLHTSSIAIKIKQERGCYGGSAITAPIEFSCGKGIIKIGDWSKTDGLRCYSGGILYSKKLDIKKTDRVILDMGRVVSTAKVFINGVLAGVRVAPPFELDITDFVIEGENYIEILVHNTLSNHMSTIPTHYNGSLESGIIG